MNKWWIFIDGIATAVYILLFWASLAGNVTYTTLKGKEYDLTMFPYIRWGVSNLFRGGHCVIRIVGMEGIKQWIKMKS